MRTKSHLLLNGIAAVILALAPQAEGDEPQTREFESVRLGNSVLNGNDQVFVTAGVFNEVIFGNSAVNPDRRTVFERVQTAVHILPENSFSSPEPGWRSADDSAPSRTAQPRRVERPTSRLLTEVETVADLVPVQSLELPELPTPFVDAASAQLISPRVAQPSLPVMLAPPESVAPHEEPAPAFAPKPLTPVAGETSPTAPSEDLEGMLQGMAWVTGTLGLGAVLSLWMLRTWLTRGGRMISTSKSLKLIETLRVGPRCGLYLVQAESHRVLVGVEHGKSMCLMPLPPSFTESLDAAADDDQAAPPPAAGFERVADVFAALRKTDERAKGATS